jgi:hypothetical protein
MSDNPLEDTPERQARIRHRAYHLWEQDGCPHGNDLEYWERARILIGIEESAGAEQLISPAIRDSAVQGVTVEEAEIQDNYGEIPGRQTDQGETRQTPMTRQQARKARG